MRTVVHDQIKIPAYHAGKCRICLISQYKPAPVSVHSVMDITVNSGYIPVREKLPP